MSGKPLVFITFGLLAVLVAVFVFFIRSAPLYYPHAVLEAPGKLELTFLRAGLASATDCEAAVASITNLVQAACPTCRVRTRQCLTTLTAEHSKLFSEEPVESPSARLASGTVTFSSLDTTFALNACRESERQSAKGAGQVFCYPAGTVRPLHHFATVSTWEKILSVPKVWFVLAALVVVGVSYLYLRSRATELIAGLLAWPRRRKQMAMLVADVLSIQVMLWLALALRLDTFTPLQGDAILLFLLGPMLAVPLFVAFGLYRSIIRYLGMQAISAIAKAVLSYAVLLAIFVHLLGFEGVPRSALAIHALLVLLLIGSGRAIARNWLRQPTFSHGMTRRNVLIYGAGSAGIQLATALSHSKELRPVAFLDDDDRLHRTRLGDLVVFPPQRLAELIDRHLVTEVLLAIPSTARQRRSEIIATLERLSVKVRTLPALSDLAEGKIKTEDLREVEIEDLLGRDSIAPDARLLRTTVSGKSVMVTGAGGSIGAELCLQIAELQPEYLVLFEQSEFALYRIEQELIHRAGTLPKIKTGTRIVPLLGSVTDQARLERVIATFGVKTIFHAAAYKHVPMVEHNPCEGVFNNIFGTYHASQAAINQGVETFILISTDKAVRPTNTMGATKRFAEMILQSSASAIAQRENHTRFSIVRFGNVLGSSGSVVPLFREQIRRGGPITVTDPRIIRYFMTISEATQLVIQAGSMGTGGEVFVLDMGAPVKIIDLARRMIHLSGLEERNSEQPLGDIEIVFSGLRPGEKLFEELLIGDNVATTAHPRIMRADEKTLSLDEVKAYLLRFTKILAEGDSDAIRTLLLESVEEFQPECGNVDFIAGHSRIPN